MNTALILGLAQINPTVGDITGNLEKIRAARIAGSQSDLLVFGELVLAGYPPEDLVLKRHFQDRIMAAAHELAKDTSDGGPAMLIGAPWRETDRLYNAALLLDNGRIAEIRFKYELPNYGVFDEKRVFHPGPLPEPIDFRGLRLGVMTCEDMWIETVSRHLKAARADLLVVLNGSPFEADKVHVRRQIALNRVRETGLPLVYVNLIGGQDELVFDGASFICLPDKGTVASLPAWQTAVEPTHWKLENGAGWTCPPRPAQQEISSLEAVYQAMVVGLRDYVEKNRFPGVIIGLSGGIDSALTAAVAVDALGADRVHCVMMPSPYTSQESLDDASEVARLLGVHLDNVPISAAMDAFAGMLRHVFGDRPADVTEENVQARCRGILLMAISNKLGLMLLTTGNKSEMSVGYATLYGDMCGGFSVLKDIYKTTVFALCQWRNQSWPDDAKGPEGRVMPERVITKPPSAELKPNQTDQDTLPPYDVLDGILAALIEDEASIDSVTGLGYDRDTVRRVWRMVDRAEYKRRQAPPGVKITRRAFGRDRRYPITNGFTNLI